MDYGLHSAGYCFDRESIQYIVVAKGTDDIRAVVFKDVKTNHFYKISFVTESLVESERILKFLQEKEND